MMTLLLPIVFDHSILPYLTIFCYIDYLIFSRLVRHRFFFVSPVIFHQFVIALLEFKVYLKHFSTSHDLMEAADISTQ